MTSFGSVRMLQGKKYPHNVRALRLLTEELLRPMFEKENPCLTNTDDLVGKPLRNSSLPTTSTMADMDSTTFGPGGIIGNTENPQTMVTWAYSRDTTMTLTGELKKMSGCDENVQMTHKEESASRIRRDGNDRESLRGEERSDIFGSVEGGVNIFAPDNFFRPGVGYLHYSMQLNRSE
ncbi:hypothetical protein GQR58_022283 [Nymphon striatum]|nr:hypothetical protein GQR58_022283 [Nymphon striatum]